MTTVSRFAMHHTTLLFYLASSYDPSGLWDPPTPTKPHAKGQLLPVGYGTTHAARRPAAYGLSH